VPPAIGYTLNDAAGNATRYNSAMATAVEIPKSKRPRRWFAPRFSLAAALAAMTLCSVGLWYWYRVPYEVVHQKVGYRLDDPLDSYHEYSIGIRGARQSEYVRRLWAGSTLRHGPLTTFDEKGAKRVFEEFREGFRHGKYTRWDEEGRLLLEGQFYRGRAQGDWVHHLPFDRRRPPATMYRSDLQQDVAFFGVFILGHSDQAEAPITIELGRCVSHWDRGLPDGEWTWTNPQGKTNLRLTLARGRLVTAEPAIDDPRLLSALQKQFRDDPQGIISLLRPVNFECVDSALKDPIVLMKDATRTPIILDARRMEKSGVNIDAKVTCRIENQPLLAAFGPILADYPPLFVDYRFGVFWITAEGEEGPWEDRTGVSEARPKPGSLLEREWQALSQLNYVETPLPHTFAILEDMHEIRFDLSQLPPEYLQLPVTKELSAISLKNCLGILLDDLDLTCRLEDDVIVIERQAEDSTMVE
jgi:hypothetical protein